MRYGLSVTNELNEDTYNNIILFEFVLLPSPSRHESFSVVDCPVGIDIVGEDRETIIHHKAAVRAEKHQRHQIQQQQKHQHQCAQDGAQNQ